jgi:tetratricopeptide (TPR) repeat protein
MSAQDATMAGLEDALRQAIAAGDARAESVARVNIACAYLQLESPKAGPAFEAALSSTRRAQNARSEGILSMAFAPYFVDRGDAARALELAQRGEQIMRNGRIGHRVLANIQLARVLYTAFSDADQAGRAVDVAIALLGEGEIMNTTDREVVLQAAAQAARSALQADDTNRALALMRVIDPDAAARLERQRQHPRPPSGLSAAQRSDATQLYTAWRARFSSSASPRVTKMQRTATELIKWDQARARRSGPSKNADAVCAFIERTQSVTSGTPIAAAAAQPTALTDDDLVFVLTLAADDTFKSIVPSWVIFELVGASAKDAALVGRCYRLAAAIGHDQRPPADTLALFQRADAALANGADNALQAEVANEMAVCFLNLRQAPAALKAAERASALAQRTRQDSLERMARGNVANALLQLQRVAEALHIFEALARDQDVAGEGDMAQITRQNIEGCRAFLRARGQAV